MENEILRISEERIKQALTTMMLKGAENSFHKGDNEDAVKDLLVLLGRYPNHQEARLILMKYGLVFLKEPYNDEQKKIIEIVWIRMVEFLNEDTNEKINDFEVAIFGDDLIERIIEINPWVYFLHASDKKYFEKGISIFRKQFCYFFTKEYLNFKKAHVRKHAIETVKIILKSLDEKINPEINQGQINPSGFHFTSGELEEGSLSVLIGISHMIIKVH
jgi:hypothetical protein